MSILVIAEHDNKFLKEATLHTIPAAFALQTQWSKSKGTANQSIAVDLLIAGKNVASVGNAAKNINGIRNVLVADAACYEHALAENLAALVINLCQDYQYEYILAPATTFGKNFLPRVAAALKVSQISDITAILDANTFERPIYAGNATAKIRALSAKKVITIRPTAFPKLNLTSGNDNNNSNINNISAITTPANANLVNINTECDLKISEFLSINATVSMRPELSAAKIVVSGGRGLQNKENFVLIEKLADKLNAAVGASRAAVDAGFVPNDYQVGQTGKIVAPNLYIAIGISGAIQHIAGMKDSKVIVAINKDAEAPIFKIADYGLVGDLFTIVPELIEAI